MRETFGEFFEKMNMTEKDELVENIIDSLLFLPEDVQMAAMVALEEKYPGIGEIAKRSLTV
ncbi:MAG: hypothetical protein PHW03_01720 [Eubacteriales bacterium]|nr:hypothetical protein [Eubacteriales bacterium]MDD4389500.1 hypothetical protein [Eubacteriales bacterium]